MTKAVVKEVWANRLRNQAGTREFAQCTAWVNFNGMVTPIVIRDSLNVSSITDNGVGDYTVNFTAAMDNANYAALGTSTWPDSGASNSSISVLSNSLGGSAVLKTTSAVRLIIQASGGSNNDSAQVSVTIFGGITL